MARLQTSSRADQVASHLREEIHAGRWKALMPGRDQLARELEVSPWSVQRALEILESEGLLVSKGGGKRREIILEAGASRPRAARVGVFPFDPASKSMAFQVDLRHQLIEAGHSVHVLSRTLTQLGMKVPHIASEARKHEVDAWVVVAATREVLEWFDAQATPVFALWGGHLKMAIAGTVPRKTPATSTALNRLIALGHRRIVYLVRPQNVKSPPIVALQSFIDVMESHDIPVGSYNMPVWEESPEGFQRRLDSLFATTPPTALIIDEPELFLAAKDHLAHRGILAPEHVSLICTDPDRTFSWYRPTISHLSWSIDPMVRHAVRWVGKVSQGKNDRRKTFAKAKFVEGGTIGPAPR